MVVYVYNPSTWETEAEVSSVPGQTELRLCLKKKGGQESEKKGRERGKEKKKEMLPRVPFRMSLPLTFRINGYLNLFLLL
jgi:hypothetical protein